MTRPSVAGLSSPMCRLGWPVYAPDDRLAGAGGDGVRILIVEDDFLAALEAEATLVDAGYEVVGIASSAEQALAFAEAGRPTLVVMDIRLIGRRDGVDAALELFERRGLRCIFATAHHDAEIRARAQPAAPLGWLPKPYTPQSLCETVRRALDELSAN